MTYFLLKVAMVENSSSSRTNARAAFGRIVPQLYKMGCVSLGCVSLYLYICWYDLFSLKGGYVASSASSWTNARAALGRIVPHLYNKTGMHILFIHLFMYLFSFIGGYGGKFCEFTDQCESSPCQNGGTCTTDTASSYIFRFLYIHLIDMSYLCISLL